jgi:transcriptional regulator with XRE-family HTH domain
MPSETNAAGGWGRNIAAARSQLGFSQAQLADRVGVSLATLTRWEQAVREPRVPDQRRLADALGVSITELFPRTDDEAELVALAATLGNGCS